ncbi:mucoidy inhibitor-like protein [Diaporthe eres]|uniref:Mucoidy inhibitor-like protein n=1 Tax=Diaporthe vaccinii TaxID=105482 RepID=A0ABR4F3W9_9PEZI|nr:mucoidy inhibitor-like protein [Diaporthe eres]
MEATHTHEYRVRDLPTRSITLFPTRAQVVRDIRNVILKPGLNQISVIGLTPTVDEHSIKVEGTGSAVISDISVELLENSEIFQEVYPDSDKDESDASDDETGQDASTKDSDDDALTPAKTELKAVQRKIVAVLDDVKRADEVVSSAEKRLGLLEEYGKKFEPKSGTEVGEIVDVYTEQRGKTFQDHIDGTIRQRELHAEVARLRKNESKLKAKVQKEDNKRTKAAVKKQQAKRKKDQIAAARLQKKAAEKARIRGEKQKFWPRSCYTVRITLDATHYTPISSRRSSVSSVTDLVKPVVDEPADPASPDPETPYPACDISISYVTSSAFWSPSYDLQLNTTANTGTLFFDAQLTNNTSEAWKDCKIILSTSQAVFSGLQDDIPKLVPWRIKLAGRFGGAASGDITKSIQEVEQRRKFQNASASTSQDKQGANLIGLPKDPFMAYMNHNLNTRVDVTDDMPQAARSRLGSIRHSAAQAFGAPAMAQAPQQQMMQQQMMQQQAPQAQHYAMQQSQQTQPNRASGGALFGSARASAVPPPPAASTQLFGSLSASAPVEEEVTLHEPEPSLDFQDSAMEETGLTTTYDLPGTKTLAPSTNASKQRVARILFNNVAFSHTIVAKYRPAAFLKARLRNASKMSLLKGPVGLTLDGTFMGRSSLPRCSSGDSFTMSLGVDPTIRVSYPKPDVKRSSSGVFSKENSTAYRRSIAITNTRGAASSSTSTSSSPNGGGGGAKPVRLVVLDQVPVSEDDKLRVEIAHPSGLAEGRAGVSTGAQEGGGAGGGGAKDWGKATATLRKGGEVSWDVELHAGRGVKLDLEYEVSLPAGDVAVQSSDASRW